MGLRLSNPSWKLISSSTRASPRAEAHSNGGESERLRLSELLSFGRTTYLMDSTGSSHKIFVRAKIGGFRSLYRSDIRNDISRNRGLARRGRRVIFAVRLVNEQSHVQLLQAIYLVEKARKAQGNLGVREKLNFAYCLVCCL